MKKIGLLKNYFKYEESPSPKTAKLVPSSESCGRFFLKMNLQNFYCKKIKKT